MIFIYIYILILILISLDTYNISNELKCSPVSRHRRLAPQVLPPCRQPWGEVLSEPWRDVARNVFSFFTVWPRKSHGDFMEKPTGISVEMFLGTVWSTGFFVVNWRYFFLQKPGREREDVGDFETQMEPLGTKSPYVNTKSWSTWMIWSEFHFGKPPLKWNTYFFSWN